TASSANAVLRHAAHRTMGAAALQAHASETYRRYLDHVRRALAEQYQLDEEFERGGASTAFLATALPDGRAVLVHLLHPQVAALLDVSRFIAELRAVIVVRHPAVVALLDAGEADD